MKSNKITRRLKIRNKIRKQVKGTLAIPRLCVYKSNKFIYAQLIDDIKGHTIVAASSRDLESPGIDVKKALEVGTAIGNKAIEKGITKIVFDRSGYSFHGQVEALAKGARAKGLIF